MRGGGGGGTSGNRWRYNQCNTYSRSIWVHIQLHDDAFDEFQDSWESLWSDWSGWIDNKDNIGGSTATCTQEKVY